MTACKPTCHSYNTVQLKDLASLSLTLHHDVVVQALGHLSQHDCVPGITHRRVSKIWPQVSVHGYAKVATRLQICTSPYISPSLVPSASSLGSLCCTAHKLWRLLRNSTSTVKTVRFRDFQKINENMLSLCTRTGTHYELRVWCIYIVLVQPKSGCPGLPEPLKNRGVRSLD